MSPPTEPAMKPPASGVTVRMYRPGGLGDCFLLAFPDEDRARYVLIDCGVFVGTSGGADRCRAIAADIVHATGGRLDVLVATHEHWDHLSGFKYAKKTFDEIEIDEVWVAWTEDPTDPVAERIREGRGVALRALVSAAEGLQASGDPRGAEVERILEFFGELSAAGPRTTADLMEYVVERSEPHFRRPGEPPVEWPGVRFYVLGPPVDEELLFKSNPSSDHSEVYEFGLDVHQPAAFYAGVLAAEAEYEELRRSSRPFDEKHRIVCDFEGPPEASGTFFEERYGFGDDAEGRGPAWRRIDTDWLGSAADLALALDGDTNNTSLALAIELVESGKVLLFPADAQVGNWLSWDTVAWHGVGGAFVRAADLLRRTVLYKVGHHGSHNATLREKGLERMESPDLVAMIPVDQEQAEKKEWKMPFGPLHERLVEKTRGRILRADTGAPEERPAGVGKKEWEAFLANTNADESDDALWVEYTVGDDVDDGPAC